VPRAVVSLSLLALPCTLVAQVVPADSTDTLRTVRRISPVLVTGAPISLEATPYAVAANADTDIRQARPGLALDEAVRQVPGVQVDNRFNHAVGERIAIRGFGARSQFGVRGIRVVVDGIPATLPDGQTNLNHVDISSLGRVEVIRGPASARFGNAAGGVLYFESMPPAREKLALDSRVVAGEGVRRGTMRASGTAGATGFAVAGSRLDARGPRDHDDAIVHLATARITRSLAAGVVELALSGVEYDADNPGSLSDSLLRRDRTSAFRNNVVQRTGEKGRHGQAGARWLRALPSGDLELTAHFLVRDIENPIPPRIIDLDRRAGGARGVWSGRVIAPLSAGWSTGVESQFQRDTRLNFVNDSGRRAARVLDQRERVTSVAPFATVWVESPGGHVTLLGGLRYDRLRFSATDDLISATNPDDSGDRIMHAWSPSAGVSARLSSAVRLYANVSTSFDTPTTSELANRESGAGGFNPDLDPQRTVSLEAGTNARVMGTLLQAALFRASVRDALISFEVPGTPGRQYFRNAGAAMHRGAELLLRSNPARSVKTRASYTFTSVRFGKPDRGASLEGHRFPGVAPHRTDLAIEFTPGNLGLALDGRYSSRLPVDDANIFYSPAYALLDFRMWIAGDRTRSSSAFLGVSNLLDRDYNASVVINAAGRRFFEPAPGRRIYAGIDVHAPLIR
jgi:iron complex outermembrane recepter protein